MDATFWSAVVGGVAALGVLGGTLARLMDRLNRSEAQGASAAATADANQRRIAALERDVLDHRVNVAREYVSKETLANLERRIVDAIDRLGDRLDAIVSGRINDRT